MCVAPPLPDSDIYDDDDEIKCGLGGPGCFDNDEWLTPTETYENDPDMEPAAAKHETQLPGDAVDDFTVNPGPSTLDEVLRWASRHMSQLTQVAPAMYNCFVETMCGTSSSVRLCTDFSGLGASEMAMAQLDRAAREAGHNPTATQVYRSTDILPHCQAVLKSHEGTGSPEHIFGDPLDRCPTQARWKLNNAKRQTDRIIARRLALREPTELVTQEQCQDLVQQCEAILSTVQLSRDRKDYCFKHRKRCQFAPPKPRGNEAKKVRDVTVAAVTCTDYSHMGKQRCMSGTSIVQLLFFFLELVTDLPDMIVLECTVRFPLALLRRFLSKQYHIQGLIFSPTHMGIPSSRWRQYILLWNREKLKPPALRFDNFGFGRVFWHDMRVTGDIYFTSSDQEHYDEIINKYRQKRGFPAMRKGLSRTWALEEVLPPGTMQHYYAFKDMANIQGKTTHAIVNINQSPFPYHTSVLARASTASKHHIAARGQRQGFPQTPSFCL